MKNESREAVKGALQYADMPCRCGIDGHHDCDYFNTLAAEVRRLEALAVGLGLALRKINLGRHGGMNATEMALEAWVALDKFPISALLSKAAKGGI